MCYSSGGKKYPVASRDEILIQISSLRKKFTTYSLYGNAAIEDVFDKIAIDSSQKLTVQTLQSVVLENLGGENFNVSPLPVMGQISSASGILTEDFNHDGFLDILMAGNFYPYRTQFGRSDSCIGLLLLGDGKGKWKSVPWDQSGFFAAGDVRNMTFVKGRPERMFILVARNNEKMSLIEVTQSALRITKNTTD
jgi:hypothetical protein